MPLNSNDVEIANIISGISKLNPAEEDKIVIYVDCNKITVEESENIYKMVKNIFPNNAILILPNDVFLEVKDNDRLKDMANMILEVVNNV